MAIKCVTAGDEPENQRTIELPLQIETRDHKVVEPSFMTALSNEFLGRPARTLTTMYSLVEGSRYAQ